MRAELWTANPPGVYIAAFDLPPFNFVPAALAWGDNAFTLADPVGVHLEDCRNKAAEKQQTPFECTCGGAFAYKQVTVVTLHDMHRIEKNRDKPITKDPNKK